MKSLLIIFAALLIALPAAAQQKGASIGISVKNHRFEPAEIRAPQTCRSLYA